MQWQSASIICEDLLCCRVVTSQTIFITALRGFNSLLLAKRHTRHYKDKLLRIFDKYLYRLVFLHDNDFFFSGKDRLSLHVVDPIIAFISTVVSTKKFNVFRTVSRTNSFIPGK
jgi:hypothetical protein